MFEQNLEDFIYRIIFSIPNAIKELLYSKTPKCSITFDSAYAILEEVFKTKDIAPLFNNESDKILTEVKPIAALYCCYFAIDYVFRNNSNNIRKLDQSFIKEFYNCEDLSDDDKGDIYNIIRRQMKEIIKVKDIEDPLFYNPRIAKNDVNTNKALIYNGNIIQYLNKSCKTINSEFYINDTVPSMTFIALRATGALPNGGNVNKSFSGISCNILEAIDKEIQGAPIFTSKSNMTYETFQRNKISYETSSEIAELINLAAVDDIFKMDRLNEILKIYIQQVGTRDLTKKEEIVIARTCSLLLHIPLPFINGYSSNIDTLITNILANKRIESIQCTANILSFSSFLFPFIIGILCYILFYSSIVNHRIAEIENSIEKIIQYLEKNSCNQLQGDLSITKEKVWMDKNYIHSVSSSKGHGKTHNIKDWNFEHYCSFNETINIMLNSRINIHRTLDDENYGNIRMGIFNLNNMIWGKGWIPELINKIFLPSEYVGGLAIKFYDSIDLKP